MYIETRISHSVGGNFEEFSTLTNFKRTGFYLGYENWEGYAFKALLD